jgi:hypothetical protein
LPGNGDVKNGRAARAEMFKMGGERSGGILGA